MSRVRNHANPLSYKERLDHVDIQAVSEGYSYLDFEVGFGRGRFLREYASQCPDRFLLGVEVRKAMVDRFVERVDLPNLLALWGTAEICIEDVIKDDSLSRVFIFFTTL